MIAVTGIGIISSIGLDLAETRKSLLTNRTGISLLEILASNYRGLLPAGEIKLTNGELSDRLGLERDLPLTRTIMLGMIAAKQALTDAGVDDPHEMALVSSTSVAGMDVSEAFFKSYINDPSTADYRKIISHDCGYCTEQIARFTGIGGYLSTISTACSSSANAILHGSELIGLGVAKRVLAGGTDALSTFTLNGFNSLKIVDNRPCRPFDDTRQGLNLGEGAAFLVLEDLDSALSRNAHVYGLFAGGANTSDAYHQTASSPEGKGARLAMQGAIQSAGIKASEVDYINAHGTATPNNDASEGRAIEDVFGEGAVFSSTKAHTGHTLAAAGSIEAAISLIAIAEQTVFPTLNNGTPMSDLSVRPVKELKRLSIKNIVSNSFGFGGNCTSLVFKRYGS